VPFQYHIAKFLLLGEVLAKSVLSSSILSETRRCYGDAGSSYVAPKAARDHIAFRVGLWMVLTMMYLDRATPGYEIDKLSRTHG
jgi:hypothetical protein